MFTAQTWRWRQSSHLTLRKSLLTCSCASRASCKLNESFNYRVQFVWRYFIWMVTASFSFVDLKPHADTRGNLFRFNKWVLKNSHFVSLYSFFVFSEIWNQDTLKKKKDFSQQCILMRDLHKGPNWAETIRQAVKRLHVFTLYMLHTHIFIVFSLHCFLLKSLLYSHISRFYPSPSPSGIITADSASFCLQSLLERVSRWWHLLKKKNFKGNLLKICFSCFWSQSPESVMFGLESTERHPPGCRHNRFNDEYLSLSTLLS